MKKNKKIWKEFNKYMNKSYNNKEMKCKGNKRNNKKN